MATHYFRCLVRYIIFTYFFLVPSYSFAAVKEVVVVIPGIILDNINACNNSNNNICEDSNYLESDLKEYLENALKSSDKSAEVKYFKWSGDFVSHGEDLKGKFERWFLKDVCSINDDCNVSFVAHSWGTIILTDFLAAQKITKEPNVKIKNFNIKNIVTYGSPVAAAQINAFSTSFLKEAVSFFKENTCSKKVWRNIVNEADPIAWPIPNVLNLQSDGNLNIKKNFQVGLYSQFFPVSNSELDPSYIPSSLLRQVINTPMDLNILLFRKETGFDIENHSTSAYNPIKIATYIAEGIDSPYLCAGYTDVSKNHQYCKSIAYAKEKCWMSGYDDRSFRGENNISRAEFLKLVMSLEYSSQDLENILISVNTLSTVYQYNRPPCFNDVKAHDWYEKFVCKAKELGIVKGDGTTNNFTPNNPVNYAEALKIALLLYKDNYPEIAVAASKGEVNWYDGYIKLAIEKGIPQLENAGDVVQRDFAAHLLCKVDQVYGSKNTRCSE